MRKLQKRLIVDVRMGSNYTSGITSTAEKISRMSIFVLYSQRQFRVIEKFILDLLVFGINKKHVGLRRCNLFSVFFVPT